ncbi:MAG TPA: hypothetical protein VNZ06_06535 [Steroidobacteraceae bacterium]|jgi:hypothetical protein|nr:hypothetical protein [Steroidobacteraceae bacterium]
MTCTPMSARLSAALLWLIACPCLVAANTTSSGAAPAAAANEPAAVLKHYINLRLAMADWPVYSKLITWPQEPASDCYWVTSHFKLDDPRPGSAHDEIIVPATYDRLGRYCSDFDLELFDESDRIEYHLVMSDGKWKIAAPLPDYPDIEIQTLLRRLANTAQSPGETPERRRQLDEVIRQLRATLRAHPRVMRPR